MADEAWSGGSVGAVRVPVMVRGTVMVHRRRCGKASCRCARSDEWHEQVILTYSQGGRARSVSLPGELVEPVRAATTRYREAREALAGEANAGLEALVAQLRS